MKYIMPIKDPEALAEYKRQWADAHRDETNQRHRENYANKPEVREKAKSYYEANKERILANAKANYLAKREQKLDAVAKYRAEHKEEYREYFKTYKRPQSTIDKQKIAQKAWAQSHKKQRCEQQKARYHRDIEKHRAKNRSKYHEDPEKSRQDAQRYRDANRDKIRARGRELDATRYRNDLEFKLRKNLRNRIRDALKNGWKSESTAELLGASIEEVRAHLESLFTDGMSWDSFMDGKIHIDHIRPCSSFSLTDPDQRALCFHYKNLQPLWAFDNMSKGAKILEVDINLEA